MALTETTNRDLGFHAPDFGLPNVVNGNVETLSDHAGSKGTVVMFICNHCPYVIHVREKLVELANRYQDQGVSFIAISSNDVANYPDDHPDKMRDLALAMDFPFPYLYDETQEVAKAYDAACTPDFSVFDGDLNCVYRGRMDGSTPGNGQPVTGEELSDVAESLINGKPVREQQFPSMGCNIKWK